MKKKDISTKNKAMVPQKSHYERLGVDAGKESVRKAFGQFVGNDFPGAFVNIVRDPERPGEVFTGHMDGDGSKFILRVLNFREVGDPSIFRGAADDGLSMNTGDVAAAGFTSGLMTLTDILNLNSAKVPKQVIMEQIGSRLAELVELYRKFGFQIHFLGGETGDLPNQIQTCVFDVNVHARAQEKDIIIGNVEPGDHIWGFASDGQAVWENELNSGIMSNGLTLAQVSTMSQSYTEKYPDLVRRGGSYEGRFLVGAQSEILGDMTIDQALIAPTRQWALLIKILLDELKVRGLTHLLHGITMNTGGGATKVVHLGKGGILYQKRMPNPPGIFHLIQEESKETWRDMYKDFNCGIGIDVIGDVKLRSVLDIVKEKTSVSLYDLGECQSWPGEENKVELETPFGNFNDY